MVQVRRGAVRRTVTGWFFAAPYAVLLAAFGLIPTGYAIYESLHTAAQPSQLSFGNYSTVFEDFRFWPAVIDVAVFMAVWIPVMVVGTLLLALLLHEKTGRLSSGLRLVYFLPGAVTGSAAVMLWYFMLSPEVSPFAPALHALGWHTNNEMFTQGHLALIFALVAFVTGVGQWIVIMFGALQTIPQEILEAARMDGAGAIRSAVQIKLPLVGKYVVYMVILSFAFALQIFVEPQLIYSITHAGSSWWSLNQLGYTFAFEQGDFGQAATVSVVLLVLSSLAALLLVFRTSFFQTEVDA
ncbi:carbohydrate ABC transporter permease [Streptomyces sp. NBC_00154]|uniref:carbohydrate ABC transporter permease n=1 Tax=Streptomyces sp. NBC_00154 TaxID=2975670 RepID=UPI002255C41B|nr:sugar ABC transporter permease [Streptomyces sp. NBC_00154]MCX5317021.1 sugar ABC transporter permease [Streptomyces sp. NBC_00154]